MKQTLEKPSKNQKPLMLRSWWSMENKMPQMKQRSRLKKENSLAEIGKKELTSQTRLLMQHQQMVDYPLMKRLSIRIRVVPSRCMCLWSMRMS